MILDNCPEPYELTDEEFFKVLPHLPSEVRDMATVARACGLRWDQAALLKWDDIDLNNKVIHVPSDEEFARRAKEAGV